MRLVVDLGHQGARFPALGASLEEGTVRRSELHICNFAPTRERPDIVPCERSGPVEDLAAFTAGWLGEILRRRCCGTTAAGTEPAAGQDTARRGPWAVTPTRTAPSSTNFATRSSVSSPSRPSALPAGPA
ncbi:hypothetical protein [Streptomyces sp. NPDC048192]|jgi:hypothetical protein|uniref:hypothetical protein n=1 Tax=unclassified Streptomyces TaxID=2593676 RepID=UPI0037227D31